MVKVKLCGYRERKIYIFWQQRQIRFLRFRTTLNGKLSTEGDFMGMWSYKVGSSFAGFRIADRWSPENVWQVCGVSSDTPTWGKELSCEDPRYHLFWQRLGLCMLRDNVCVCVCVESVCTSISMPVTPQLGHFAVSSHSSQRHYIIIWYAKCGFKCESTRTNCSS